MAQPLISLIMPVYNAEKYLAAALDSLLAQDYQNFEALLIDDGAVDTSPVILAEYARRDSRIRVTRVANGGQAQARAVGLAQARGQFITFMDSDDLALPTWLSGMAHGIGAADVAQVNYYTYLGATKSKFTKPFAAKAYTVRGDDCYRLWLEDKDLRGYLWNKLFRANLFTPALPVADFNLMEDAYLIGQLLPRITQINLVDEPLYCYRLNPASTVHDKFHQSDLIAIHQLGALYLQVAEAKPALSPVAVRKYAALSLFVLSKMNPAELVQNWGYVQQLGSVLSDYSRVFAKEVDAKEAKRLTATKPVKLTGSLHGRLAAWSELIGLPSTREADGEVLGDFAPDDAPRND